MRVHRRILNVIFWPGLQLSSFLYQLLHQRNIMELQLDCCRKPWWERHWIILQILWSFAHCAFQYFRKGRERFRKYSTPLLSNMGFCKSYSITFLQFLLHYTRKRSRKRRLVFFFLLLRHFHSRFLSQQIAAWNRGWVIGYDAKQWWLWSLLALEETYQQMEKHLQLYFFKCLTVSLQVTRTFGAVALFITVARWY